MPLDRAKAITVAEALAEQIAALEAVHPHLTRRADTLTDPPGLKRIGPLREHVHDDPLVIRTAFARWLYWRHALSHVSPTHASLMRAARRIRGWMLYLLARRRDANGQPLPLQDRHTRVPHYALAPWPAKALKRVGEPDARRAEGDSQEQQENADNVDNADNADNPGAWWEAYGAIDLSGLADFGPFEDEFASLAEEFGTPYIEDVGTLLSFADVVKVAGIYGLDADTLAQVLEAAWANSVATDAGAQVLNDAGVMGAFDLADPNVLDFLRYQSGALIRNIDQSTRTFVAQVLYDFLGGNNAYFQPQGVNDLARLLQDFATAFDTRLAGMSRYRAYLIAVTETARAQSFGSFVAMWQLGARKKQWVITAGACLICMGNAEAGAIDLTEAFPSRDQAPPGHPQCRCALQAAVPDTFDPSQWTPRDTTPFTDALYGGDVSMWPQMDLSALSDIELPDVDLAALPEEIRQTETRRAQVALPTAQDFATACLTPLHPEGVRRDQQADDVLRNDFARFEHDGRAYFAKRIAGEHGVAPHVEAAREGAAHDIAALLGCVDDARGPVLRAAVYAREGAPYVVTPYIEGGTRLCELRGQADAFCALLDDATIARVTLLEYLLGDDDRHWEQYHVCTDDQRLFALDLGAAFARVDAAFAFEHASLLCHAARGRGIDASALAIPDEVLGRFAAFSTRDAIVRRLRQAAIDREPVVARWRVLHELAETITDDNAEYALTYADLARVSATVASTPVTRSARRRKPTPLAILERDARLGQLLAEAADAAALRWARAAGVRLPTHLDEWKAVKRRVDAHGADFHDADGAYAQALFDGFEQAIARWRAEQKG